MSITRILYKYTITGTWHHGIITRLRNLDRDALRGMILHKSLDEAAILLSWWWELGCTRITWLRERIFLIFSCNIHRLNSIYMGCKNWTMKPSSGRNSRSLVTENKLKSTHLAPHGAAYGVPHNWRYKFTKKSSQYERNSWECSQKSSTWDTTPIHVWLVAACTNAQDKVWRGGGWGAGVSQNRWAFFSPILIKIIQVYHIHHDDCMGTGERNKKKLYHSQ